jgi:hypothetical protein
MTTEPKAARRYITVFAVGDDGNVERRWTISAMTDLKLAWMRYWTAEVYVETFHERPRSVNVSDWPLLGSEQAAHGVEGATFAFPESLPPRP